MTTEVGIHGPAAEIAAIRKVVVDEPCQRADNEWMASTVLLQIGSYALGVAGDAACPEHFFRILRAQAVRCSRRTPGNG